MAPRFAALFKASLVPFTLMLAVVGGTGSVRADDDLITQF